MEFSPNTQSHVPGNWYLIGNIILAGSIILTAGLNSQTTTSSQLTRKSGVVAFLLPPFIYSKHGMNHCLVYETYLRQVRQPVLIRRLLIVGSFLPSALALPSLSCANVVIGRPISLSTTSRSHWQTQDGMKGSERGCATPFRSADVVRIL